MISGKMVKAINEQINKEVYSAYLYFSMESYAMSIGLAGFAHWFRIQVQEELTHAAKFFDYVNHQGSRVLLQAIDQPTTQFLSPLDAFQKTLEHEQIVTRSIYDLAELAVKEKDHATSALLQWFVTEQVEEEANATEIIQKLKLIGKDGNGLLMLDSQLATRVFVPAPAPAAQA